MLRDSAEPVGHALAVLVAIERVELLLANERVELLLAKERELRAGG